jgi:hypothetical protein
VACVLVAPTTVAIQGWRYRGGWLRGFLEEADRQLGGACCLDLGAGTRRQIRSSRAEGICEGGLELRAGAGQYAAVAGALCEVGWGTRASGTLAATRPFRGRRCGGGKATDRFF